MYKNIRVLLCEKPLVKSTKCSRNEAILKLGHLSKGYSQWTMAIAFRKMVSLGQKLKWPKTCKKLIYKHTRVVLCKKPLEKKKQIFEK